MVRGREIKVAYTAERERALLLDSTSSNWVCWDSLHFYKSSFALANLCEYLLLKILMKDRKSDLKKSRTWFLPSMSLLASTNNASNHTTNNRHSLNSCYIDQVLPCHIWASQPSQVYRIVAAIMLIKESGLRETQLLACSHTVSKWWSVVWLWVVCSRALSLSHYALPSTWRMKGGRKRE